MDQERETRAYVVLARRPEDEALTELGTYDAVDSEAAIAQAAGPDVEVLGGVIQLGVEPSAYVAVSKRNWIELPVERQVQTRLKIGGREFVVDAKEDQG